MQITLRDLYKSFRDPAGKRREVITALSAEIPSGALVAVTGPSGVGKTTLFNLVSGLLLPESGTITAGGTELPKLSERKRDRWRAQNVGYIFQTFNLLSDLTVLDNVVLPHVLTGNGTIDGIRGRAVRMLEEFGVGAEAEKYPYQLSGGQRQRVAVARALLTEPSLVLADEPTANLDNAAARIGTDAILSLRGRATILIATYDSRLGDVKPDLTIALGGEVPHA